jgi:methylmalonyl-CoA mutase cobalamin-binding domain/chain
MNRLGEIVRAVENYDRHVELEVRRAREDADFGRKVVEDWRCFRAGIGRIITPTGIELPRLALPDFDESGAVVRYRLEEGLPGGFPFVNSAYREMYLEPGDAGAGGQREEPTRLFAGLGLAEDTNERFRYLTSHQRNIRLSTAFDGPTLYGLDSDTEGAFGKIGEGGVAIDTTEDMERLYDGFPLDDPAFSVSMTINGPAPAILAMYFVAARRRFGQNVWRNLRGTVQADVLKEVQAQNEILFPVEASLRFLADMIEFTAAEAPRWYPVSISGYHIAEAGATPVQQAAYTLSNGFTYVEMLRERGLEIDHFGPRLSFFLDCGLDIEYLALGRVCRKLWAIGMRDVFGAGENAQRFKLHTQTSGRSLVTAEFQNNLTRTAVELVLAYANATNSCHSNSADEPFTTPSEEYVRLAAHAQSILLEESGLFRHMMNTLSGSPGMKAVERAVQRAVLDEFREIDRLGGVLPAMEQRFQRSRIQSAAHRMEKQISEGVRPVIGVNRYAGHSSEPARVKLARLSREKKEAQIERLRQFKERHAGDAPAALGRLERVVEAGENVFRELLQTVECCSLGQITECLQRTVGKYRPGI